MNPQSHADAKQADCLVRTPRPADYACMADLAEQLGYECTAEEIRERLCEMQDGNRYTVLVAELHGGRIVGWIGAYIFRSVETRSCAEISGLVVDRGGTPPACASVVRSGTQDRRYQAVF